MSKTITVTITILDKRYEVSCKAEERDELMASAEIVDARMREIHASGSVVGLERVAVMAALNIAHDYVRASAASASKAAELTDRVVRTIEEGKALSG